MEEDNSKRKPLDLDWGIILGKSADEDSPELVIETKKKKNKSNTDPFTMTSDCSPREEYARMTDRELEELLGRQMSNMSKFRLTLPDNGEKLQLVINGLLEERDRRNQHRTQQMDIDECEKPTESTSSGVSNDFRQESRSASPHVHPKSQFASILSKRMEENTDFKAVHAFDKELSTLGHCNHEKTRSNGGFSERERQKQQSSSRRRPFQCASTLSHNSDRYGSSSEDQKGRVTSNHPSHHKGESLFSCSHEKKDTRQVLTSDGPRHKKEQTVVLVDEDDTQQEESMARENKLVECIKNAKIFYPSRDDPKSVEICYKDMDCLSPEGFLTSPIMNFYIRYLWLRASPTNKAICDYHFFNTFFYEKLKQAVSYKGNDKGSFFIKFRRWWRGVNIFQKAYVFVPIHEDLHWSLVIICIPDKEDESGPIVLHLDSLRLHHSKSIFDNIKRYLKEEWNYMRKEIDPLDLPISKRIWEHLPRRIDEKIITVPQQKNDYDCGLFVLFFIERFIEQAPERLKKKDLEMFGKQWFKPEEASGLRAKIRKLLLDEFEIATKDGCSSESSPVPSGGASP